MCLEKMRSEKIKETFWGEKFEEKWRGHYCKNCGYIQNNVFGLMDGKVCVAEF